MGPLRGSVGVGVGDDGEGWAGWSSAASAAGSWGGGADFEAGFLAAPVGLAVEDEFLGGGLEAVDQEVTAADLEEADMTEDWRREREDDSIARIGATTEIGDWLSLSDANGVSPRERLKDEQQRSQLRREIRAHLPDIRSGGGKIVNRD
jgi:hypothetical protein